MSAAASFPRPALIGAMTLVAASVAVATVARFTGPMPSDPPPAAAVAARDLRFADMTNGGVDVTDADTNARIQIMAPGSNGFLRALLRGLARERRLDDLGRRPPFRLTQWADGRITLDDTATGERVDLEAFGATNASVFERFLTEGRPNP